jgi:LmbE family N-acetylglucosaminyl deacetylase
MLRRLLLVAIAALVIVWFAQPSPSLPLLRLYPTTDTRLLVISPHPDDEAIAAAGLIQRVRSAGGRVRVVVITSGDALAPAIQRVDPGVTPGTEDFRRFGRLREDESRHAMAILGVQSDDVVFLGFPDEGMCLLASAYLSTRSRPLTSPYTGRATPPSDEQVVRGVTYRGSDLRMELEQIVTAFAPTMLAMPDPEDEHPDHCASYIFGRAALDRMARDRSGAMPRVLRYVVHADDWPSARDSASTSVMPPPGLDEPADQWRTFLLTVAEARSKKAALAAYVSQWSVVGRLLRGFARPNELFLEGAPAHDPECWCDAEHVATELPPEKRRRHAPRARP